MKCTEQENMNDFEQVKILIGVLDEGKITIVVQ